jgi:hypothetical protein
MEMKKIVVCDNDEFDTVLPFCLSAGIGIELQSFWNPTSTEGIPTKIEYQRKKMTGIGFRALHGPFGDLNCGSYDSMIRELSRKRMSWGYQIAKKLGATHIISITDMSPTLRHPKTGCLALSNSGNHLWKTSLNLCVSILKT